MASSAGPKTWVDVLPVPLCRCISRFLDTRSHFALTRTSQRLKEIVTHEMAWPSSVEIVVGFKPSRDSKVGRHVLHHVVHARPLKYLRPTALRIDSTLDAGMRVLCLDWIDGMRSLTSLTTNCQLVTADVEYLAGKPLTTLRCPRAPVAQLAALKLPLTSLATVEPSQFGVGESYGDVTAALVALASAGAPLTSLELSMETPGCEAWPGFTRLRSLTFTDSISLTTRLAPLEHCSALETFGPFDADAPPGAVVNVLSLKRLTELRVRLVLRDNRDNARLFRALAAETAPRVSKLVLSGFALATDNDEGEPANSSCYSPLHFEAERVCVCVPCSFLQWWRQSRRCLR